MEFPSFPSALQLSLDLNIRPLQLLGDSLVEARESDHEESGLSALPHEDDRSGVLAEKLIQVNEENMKLNEMLVVVCENYNALMSCATEILSKSFKKELSPSRKRNLSGGGSDNRGNSAVANNGVSESSSSDDVNVYRKKPREEIVQGKITRVRVRTESSDTKLIVKDGNQWRKYGQKITRDNPCPRAYFRCSFAPSCPVKKKVQRSVEDPSVLVATYDGEHNHPKSPRSEAAATACMSRSSASVPSKSPSKRLSTLPPQPNETVMLDLMKSESASNNMTSPKLQDFLVEQVASYLTKDPSFTTALATAISGKRRADTRLPTDEQDPSFTTALATAISGKGRADTRLPTDEQDPSFTTALATAISGKRRADTRLPTDEQDPNFTTALATAISGKRRADTRLPTDER